MAKSDILLWVVSIMFAVIIGMVVVPSITKSGETARIAVINGEINSIRNGTILWLAQSSSTGDFTGVTAKKVSEFLPGLVVDTDGKFVSKLNSAITYEISPKSGDASLLSITVSGLDKINGAEASVFSNQKQATSGSNDTTLDDGKLVLEYRG